MWAARACATKAQFERRRLDDLPMSVLQSGMAVWRICQKATCPESSLGKLPRIFRETCEYVHFVGKWEASVIVIVIVTCKALCSGRHEGFSRRIPLCVRKDVAAGGGVQVWKAAQHRGCEMWLLRTIHMFAGVLGFALQTTMNHIKITFIK